LRTVFNGERGVHEKLDGVGSHVPYESLIELGAAYMPDIARAVSPELIPEEGSPPGFDIV
jgi:hypothetical protein